MGNLGKITSIKKEVGGQSKSLARCLYDRGLNRQEGTFEVLSPWKEKGGKFRTGLDADAIYIKNMSPEEAKQEKEYVSSLKEKAQSMFANVDLGPASNFYSDMAKYLGDTSATVCPFAKMRQGDNIFNLDDPYDLVTYAYLRVHPRIASSGEAVYSGNNTHARYYVNDSDIETEMAYKRKSKITKAFAVVEKLSEDTRKIVARQCQLPVKEGSSPKEVYNLLIDYIDASKISVTQGNVDTFMKYAEMKKEHLDVRNTLDLAITYNVYRKTSMGIYNGENLIGKTKQAAIDFLSNIQNQEELLNIKEAIKMKKSIKEV